MEWSVIWLGYKIWRWKLKDPKVFIKSSVSEWESSFKKVKIKFSQDDA